MFYIRRILVFLLACAVACSPKAGIEYINPILHLDYSDPDVCRVGEDYYMTASSFNCFPGLPILHSKDLVHREQIGAALLDYPCDGTDADFRTTVQHGNAIWAPAIRYHDGWFYIYVGDPDRGVFMVRSKDPAGIWETPVWVVRQKGFIDPCPLWDKDGKAWLSHGLAGSRAGLKSVLFVAPMAADGWPIIGEDPDGDGVGQPVVRYEISPLASLGRNDKNAVISSGGEAGVEKSPYGLDWAWQYPAIPGPLLAHGASGRRCKTLQRRAEMAVQKPLGLP